MRKWDVQIALEKVAEARHEWAARQREFQAGVDSVLGVLIHEAARAYMSDVEVAKALGVKRSQVRDLMRKHGLSPASGKRALSEQAAKALVENAALMGIEPHQMDLTSPLAYLPMGEQMKRQLRDQQVSKVTEIPETDVTPEGLLTRLQEARQILLHVLSLRMHGEGSLPMENWQHVDAEVEGFLRAEVGM